MPGLRTLLLAYADGAKDADAFAKAFGKSVDAVEASFKTFVDQRYGALREAMARSAVARSRADDLPALRARAAAAPGNFISQLALGQALLQAGRPRPAPGRSLERAAALAPQAQRRRQPARAARADRRTRRATTPRARRELRALLTYDHANVERRAPAGGARGASRAPSTISDFALRLVADLDPFDADAHRQLGRAAAREERRTRRR